MDTIPETVSLFLDWIFLDLASRAPSGKNPDELIGGLFRAYLQVPSKGRGKASARRGRAYMHGTDLSLRKYVAILALSKLGFSVDRAALEVAPRLAKTMTANKIEAIRTGFYKFHPPIPPDNLLTSWEYCFASWKEWAIRADERTIDFVANRLIIAQGRGEDWAARFREFMQRLRSEQRQA